MREGVCVWRARWRPKKKKAGGEEKECGARAGGQRRMSVVFVQFLFKLKKNFCIRE